MKRKNFFYVFLGTFFLYVSDKGAFEINYRLEYHFPSFIPDLNFFTTLELIYLLLVSLFSILIGYFVGKRVSTKPWFYGSMSGVIYVIIKLAFAFVVVVSYWISYPEGTDLYDDAFTLLSIIFLSIAPFLLLPSFGGWLAGRKRKK